MDRQLLEKVISELSLLLPGGRVDRIYQNERGEIILVIVRGRKFFPLLLSPDKNLPRMHLVSRKPAARDGATDGFVLYLRSHLVRAAVAGVELAPDNRLTELSFSKNGKDYRLFFELFRPRGRLFFTDGMKNILTAMPRQEEAPHTRTRYQPPPGMPLPDLREGEKLREEAVGAAAKAESGTANSAAEQLYERLLRGRDEERLKRELAHALRKALARAERKLEAVAGDLATAEKADAYREAGELILANLRSLEKGEGSAVLRGYDGRSVPVTLDPAITPSENAERYFRKYRKARAGRDRIAARLDDVRAETARLNSFREELRACVNVDALALLRGKLETAGVVPAKSRGQENKLPKAAPDDHRSYHFEGWEILVGKSAAGNDRLTRQARPDDLWLHAEGMPGSHVVIRNPRRKDIPQEIIRKAASLAAFYSRGKLAGAVPIAYTPVKYVRKPKGAAPGQVMLTRRRTLTAKPESGV